MLTQALIPGNTSPYREIVQIDRVSVTEPADELPLLQETTIVFQKPKLTKGSVDDESTIAVGCRGLNF